MLISKKLNAALNDQITMELAAHIQYLAIAHYFESRSLDRLAEFFYNQAEEEKFHALKIVHYLGEASAEVRFAAIPAPKQDFASAEETAQLFVDQERAVTDSFYAMNAMALEEQDYITQHFLQWFINEQLEEMATSTKLLDLIRMAGDNLLMVEMMIPDLEAAQDTGGGGVAG